jgi:hypothetical protein
MPNINLVCENILDDFCKCDFYNDNHFFVIHPDYINYLFKTTDYLKNSIHMQCLDNSKEYYRFINLEVKRFNLGYTHGVFRSPLKVTSLYLPFIFKNTSVKLWKF